jgi:hypothetical protein
MQCLTLSQAQIKTYSRHYPLRMRPTSGTDRSCLGSCLCHLMAWTNFLMVSKMVHWVQKYGFKNLITKTVIIPQPQEEQSRLCPLISDTWILVVQVPGLGWGGWEVTVEFVLHCPSLCPPLLVLSREEDRIYLLNSLLSPISTSQILYHEYYLPLLLGSDI